MPQRATWWIADAREDHLATAEAAMTGHGDPLWGLASRGFRLRLSTADQIGNVVGAARRTTADAEASAAEAVWGRSSTVRTTGQDEGTLMGHSVTGAP